MRCYDSDKLIAGGGIREEDLNWPVICNKCEAVTKANFERLRL